MSLDLVDQRKQTTNQHQFSPHDYNESQQVHRVASAVFSYLSLTPSRCKSGRRLKVPSRLNDALTGGLVGTLPLGRSPFNSAQSVKIAAWRLSIVDRRTWPRGNYLRQDGARTRSLRLICGPVYRKRPVPLRSDHQKKSSEIVVIRKLPTGVLQVSAK